MKNSEAQTRRILSFLYNEMSADEKNTFIQELNTNPDLKNELEMHQNLDTVLKQEIDVHDFKSKLNKIHNDSYGKDRGKIINLKNKWYWAAASVTLFSGTALYTLFKPKPADKLYSKYYKVWEPALTTRGAVSQSDLETITNYFENKNYQAALNSIEGLQTEVKTDPKLLLIKGCSLMELNKFDKAYSTFNQFENLDYTLYTETGNWYKALCLIKLDKIEKAKAELINISALDNTYAEEAEDLIRKLE